MFSSYVFQVFPQKGLLFYTDWGDETPHIAKMNMDGTERRHIINESIAWPNALSIDYITEKVSIFTNLCCIGDFPILNCVFVAPLLAVAVAVAIVYYYVHH